MKNITLDLPPETAKLVLPSLEKQHKLLTEQAAAIAGQILLIRTALQNGLQKPESPDLFVSKVTKTENGRAKKGETEKAVSEYLKASSSGLGIAAIAEATGTTYGSVRRILHNFKSKAETSEERGLWKWIG